MAKRVWILLCTLSLVYSCDKEEDVPIAEAITPSFVGQKGVSGGLNTRATDETWYENDAVGIYMLNTSGYSLGTNALPGYNNRKYIFKNATDAKKGTLTPAAGHAMYYPADDEPVRFVAYYPYFDDANMNPVNTLAFLFADQNTQSDKETKDFAFHKGTEEYKKSKPNVKMEFNHKFCKIKITVKRGDGGPSLQGLNAKLTKMPKFAVIDLGVIAENETHVDALMISTEFTDIIPWVYDVTDNKATVEAIVAPHTGTGAFANRQFIFTAGGKNYTYNLLNGKTFASGNEYNFEITLKPFVEQVFDGMSNCYIVKPNTTKTFPISRAYMYDGTNFRNTLHTGDEYTDKFDVSVIWEDPVGLITAKSITGSGNAAKMTVTTNKVPGNAVVKICKKGEDTPVWSYHIWVTDYDPDNGGATWTNPNSTTFTFMNRNLGATEATLSPAGRGLLYQWGRKDPFPGGPGTAGYAALSIFKGMPDSGTPGSITVPVNTPDAIGIAEGIKESIERPTAFFAPLPESSTTKEQDWLPARKDDLWNAFGNKKTIYDPCPEGWRVPVRLDDTVSNVPDDNSPWKANGNWGNFWSEGTDMGGTKLINHLTKEEALYPASGYRQGNGEFLLEDINGHVWTASVSDEHIKGYNLSYYKEYNTSGIGKIFPSNQDPKSFAYSVRCVKEDNK